MEQLHVQPIAKAALGTSPRIPKLTLTPARAEYSSRSEDLPAGTEGNNSAFSYALVLDSPTQDTKGL